MLGCLLRRQMWMCTRRDNYCRANLQSLAACSGGRLGGAQLGRQGRILPVLVGLQPAAPRTRLPAASECQTFGLACWGDDLWPSLLDG